MTRFLAVFAVMLAFAGGARSETFGDDAAVKDALVALETQSWVAWKARDGKFFDGFLSDDHVEIHANGPQGKRAVVAGVTSPACVVESYTLGDMQFTRLTLDTAMLVYRAAQSTLCGGKPVPSPVWATSVYAKRHGRWLNVLYEHTPAAA